MGLIYPLNDGNKELGSGICDYSIISFVVNTAGQCLTQNVSLASIWLQGIINVNQRVFCCHYGWILQQTQQLWKKSKHNTSDGGP
jgi:hypothetical protein